MISSPTISAVRSMTGQGRAEGQGACGSVVIEVRAVNHRGFKCSLRTSDSLSALEGRIETLTRSMIRRGAVHLSILLHRPPGEGLPTVDADAVESYYRQLKQIGKSVGEGELSIDLAALLGLPGVVIPPRDDPTRDDEVWELVRGTLVRAIDSLNEMRVAEGFAMAGSLNEECRSIRDRVDAIATLAPQVVSRYRQRLQSRIDRALAENGIQAEPAELLREVQIFADRADISEELTRLRSHLGMFETVLAGDAGESGEPEPAGRKLDFIVQEMLRETNTIGSKASDADVSGHVVEIKCGIERIRELVQNLE